MTDRIYLDNAATAWPKAPSVAAQMARALDIPGSAGRSAHSGALQASRDLFSARRILADFLHVPQSHDLLFQPGCTQAANLVLKGLLARGDKVLVSSTEHNSVTRPLYELSLSRGVKVTQIPLDEWGVIDLDFVQKELSGEDADEYRAVVCVHGSNVSGAIQPIEKLAEIAHGAGVKLIVDGAQAAGHLAVDLTSLGADAWFASGHKGLGGPQGVGILYLAPGFAPRPLITGGTGSGTRDQPDDPLGRPDAYEAGTEPLPAILGLAGATGDFATNAAAYRDSERGVAQRLHAGLMAIPSIRVLGPPPGVPRLPLVSIVSDRVSASQLSAELDMRWNIATRAGVHCSPSTHEALGTLDTGAVRLSCSHHTTAQEIDTTLEAISTVIQEAS